MNKPRLLDLFCGAGGAAMGYHRAGFEVVGVDIKPQPHYPFEFHQADALTFPLEGYDAYHASPPCQRYSNLTPISHKEKHPDFIYAIRERLLATNKPYVIENVIGAKNKLLNPIMLCGSMFGLRTQRHRLLEVAFPVVAPCGCNHNKIPLLVTTASKASREKRFRLGMKPKSVSNAPLAYGIGWMGFAGLKEAIPPAYTEYIGKYLIEATKYCSQELEI